ncbi:MAG: family 78 glycoside hydrolase catalytic domain, partial [Thermoguttaceae bacterium]
ESVHVRYAGKPLRSFQQCFWTVQAWTENETARSEPAGWTMGFLPGDAWQARWIDAGGAEQTAPAALPLFRREFQVAQAVERATVFACGLGFHEIRVNGSKVGNHELEPGWTNYRKTCLYSAYDVTGLLKPGGNAVGVMLGNGMYNVTGGRYTKFLGSFGLPKLILELRVEYADGTTERIVSDRSWKTAAGPIRFSCIFGGEDYDAPSELPGWDSPGLDDSQWTPAREVEGPGGRLTTRSAPPIGVMEEFEPVKVTEPRPGVFVYDFGQNFSGWPELVVSGPAGATVKLVPGELLDESGLVTQRSSGGPMWFSYTLKGHGEETWHPRFSYYGFRYVQVEGAVPAGGEAAASPAPQVRSLRGQFLYPATAMVGRFACSNEDVNRVHALILAAIKSNFKSVLTDCPHREKLGWLECSHLLAGCFMYNFDCARFYEKIAGDMGDSQLESGLVPDIAPEYTVFQGGFRDSPEWGSAVLISPWRTYWMYGDPALLQSGYENMKRYVGYLGTRADGHIVAHGLGDWYDIGPGPPGPSKLTSLGLTATGVYYQDLEILHRTAALLGQEADRLSYAELARQVQDAFNTRFFRADEGQYDRNSQTGNAMPLFLGLVPPEHREKVLANVVESIRGNGNRVTAGDVGFYYVVQALLAGGRSDVLYQMLCQTDGPGYMYQLRKGATSLTEAWDTNPNSSQNHCMLGHIEEWLYSGLLGIRAGSPGFRHIVIRPQMPGDLAWAEGHYDSMYGRIASRWRREVNRVTMEVTLPANTTATIHVPATDPARVTEGGKPVDQAAGISEVRVEKASVVLEAGSGTYRFESP